jgi:hypothetical protein
MNSALRKAINVKAMLKRKYFKDPTSLNWETYRQQRNKVTDMKRKSIKTFFVNKCNQNQKHANVKTFWDTVKPFFSSKICQGSGTINLLENDKVITNTKEICDIFNNYFVKVGMTDPPTNFPHATTEEIICNFHSHESILSIKESLTGINHFTFKPVNNNTIFTKLRKLNTKKACGYDGIPAKILKLAASPISKSITPILNASLSSNMFPDSLKCADVSPVYKKTDNLIKENYRPISVLTSLSKVFESVMCDQMNCHFQNILSVWLSAYRKNYSCENVIIAFVECLRKALDNNELAACILMDLSKAFDSLPHGLLLAKLHAYGFTMSSCDFIRSYLSNRKQRVKINGIYSSWDTLTTGVPQGSIAGPLLFNVFMNDIFMCIDKSVKLFNYADDNTLVFTHQNKHTLVSKLEHASKQAVLWFQNNYMQANPNKFQALYLNRNKSADVLFDFGPNVIKPDSTVKLLGVKIDDKLSFENHIIELCNKAGKQLNALRRLSKVLNFESKLKIYNSFISSHFKYCPLICNECSKSLVNKLEKLQERALRFVCDSKNSTYDDILKKTNLSSLSKSRNQAVAIQTYKILNDLAPPLTSTFFTRKESPYNFRNPNQICIPRYNSIRYGKHSFHYRAAVIWNSLSPKIKSSKSVDEFRRLIKTEI